MVMRKPVLLLLFVTVVAPIVLYTDRISNTSSLHDIGSTEILNATVREEIARVSVLHQASNAVISEPIASVYHDNSSTSNRVRSRSEEKPADQTTNVLPASSSVEHKSRALAATAEGEGRIEQVRDWTNEDVAMDKGKSGEDNEAVKQEKVLPTTGLGKKAGNSKIQAEQSSAVDVGGHKRIGGRRGDDKPPTVTLLRNLKDQLITARVLKSLAANRISQEYSKELRTRMRDIERIVEDANSDADLPKNAPEKLKAMKETLDKGKHLQGDCAAVVKRLRAMLQATDEYLRINRKQVLFLTQLAAKTLPRGLHCLPLRLTTEYYALNSGDRQLGNQDRLDDPDLYHYALFSDNVLATAVVVNSTVFHAKEPEKHVFHIVTDRLNYAAMRMWFLANPPGKAAIQIQHVQEFTWLNSSYSPVLSQLGSQSMINYYFRPRANADDNLKYRNPKYLSILNHLRFYLPEILPKLNKVLFLDDDIVVLKDLTALWDVDLRGRVNGAVETCGENFHRFDRYLNFSNPLIAKNFNPRACGWAYGMNIFDLAEWKNQNITQIYHYWQKQNEDRTLWKLGTLPPGLITFSGRTHPLDRAWHVLGLGYNPNVNKKDIERAAVIHYNGNKKPWLDIGMSRYRGYWSKFVNYDHVYLRECNINP